MSIRFRQLDVRVLTEKSPVGVTLSFSSGLNVLAAPNTSGKSTSVMSILYALGLEGMLGPSHAPPLPDALQSLIQVGDFEVPVLESTVRLELENHDGEVFTATRKVTGTNKERQLIRGVFGADISLPDSAYQRKDFYVRTQGAAQSGSGFHRFLAEFAGVDVPRVPGVESISVPLYLECLFPFFFVDQLTGWRDIKSRMPTYLRVPEMAKRSTEFVLGLDVLTRAIERQELEQRSAELKSDWKRETERAKGAFANHNVVLRGLPDTPLADWPPSPVPQALYSDGDNWIELNVALENVRDRQQEIVDEEIPRAEQVSQEVIAKLQSTEAKLESYMSRLSRATQDAAAEDAHVASIKKRLQTLEDDLKDYTDLKRILDRGGDVPIQVADGTCPTCRQPIKDSLLPQARSAEPMSLEENIEFIRDQIGTFVRMRRDALEVLEAKERQRGALADRVHQISQGIRSLKKTLHSHGRTPSIAAVREHVSLDEAADRLQTAVSGFDEFMQRMELLSKEWLSVSARLKKLSNARLSEMDEKKIAFLEDSFVSQLSDYSFSSFKLEHLSINRESYRPARDGYDIGLTSASDTIRIIWAYILGMLEVDLKFHTNHLGFVVFDEPRQQGAEKLSFDALLHRAADVSGDQQIIFATSEDQAQLDEMLESIDCNYMRFDGKILR